MSWNINQLADWLTGVAKYLGHSVDVVGMVPVDLGLFANPPWDFKGADLHVSKMMLITWHDTAMGLMEVADLDGTIGHDACVEGYIGGSPKWGCGSVLEVLPCGSCTVSHHHGLLGVRWVTHLEGVVGWPVTQHEGAGQVGRDFLSCWQLLPPCEVCGGLAPGCAEHGCWQC